MVVSLGLHAAVLAAVLLLPAAEPQPRPPLDELAVVELLTEPPPAALPKPPPPAIPEPAADPLPPAPPAPRRVRKPRPSVPARPLGPHEAGAGVSGDGGGTVGAGASGEATGGLALGRAALAPREGEPPGVVAPRLSASYGTSLPPTAPSTDRVIRTPADAGFRPDRKGRLVYRSKPEEGKWSAELLPDGRVRFRDPKRCFRRPCWLAHKKRLLDRTWDLRLSMAKDFARSNIRRQLAALRGDLAKIWASDRPPKTRRALIFEDWDDCAEPFDVDGGELGDLQPTKLDRFRKNAAVRARAQIVEFIRTEIPEGSALAYTTAELAALNARRVSTERFDPYGTG